MIDPEHYARSAYFDARALTERLEQDVIFGLARRPSRPEGA